VVIGFVVATGRMNKGGQHRPPFSCQQNNQFAFEGRPAVASAVPAARAEKASLAAKGTGTLLLVEDETLLRMLAATSLKWIGYTVLEGWKRNIAAGRGRGACRED